MLHEKFLLALNFLGLKMPDGEFVKQINSFDFLKTFKRAYETYLLQKYGSMETFGNSVVAPGSQPNIKKYGMDVFHDKESYVLKLWVGSEKLNFSDTNNLKNNANWIVIRGSQSKPNEIEVDSAYKHIELSLSPFIFEKQQQKKPVICEELYIFFELYEKVMNEITNTVLFVN